MDKVELRQSEDALIITMKDMPILWGEYTTSVPARVALGADSPWFAAMATNLSPLDPDMLSALIDTFAQTVVGYDPPVLLPAITCPVLLLQADPTLAGLGMPDDDVAQALALLRDGTHVQLHGRNHGDVIQPTQICSFLMRHGLWL